jgi:sulfite exporter TauE/SafE
MKELPLILLGGLLGSSHCIGMCGPLALALGAKQTRLRANVARQLVFSVGRIFTYGFGGAAAAFSGWWLAHSPIAVVNVQATLSIVAGVALLILGMSAAGVLPVWSNSWWASQNCSATKWFRTLLYGPGLVSALLAGVFTGFIPCGLVYAFLALAASTGSVIDGWLTMIAFGVGTMPLMVLTGSGAALLSLSARTRALKLAAWCVMATGFISLARGLGHLEWLRDWMSPGCPFCN